MTNFVIVAAKRVMPAVKKSSRVTGIASRQNLIGENTHNPYSPVPTVITEDSALQQ